MPHQNWKTELQGISTNAFAELASFKAGVLHQDNRLIDYPDLLRACEGHDLENLLTLCNTALRNANSLEEFKSAFQNILKTHWEQTQNTALSYLVKPDASGNQYLFKLFEKVFGHPPTANDLLLLSPTIQHELVIETSVLRPDSRQIMLSCVPTPFKAPSMGADEPLIHYLVIGDVAFNAHSFLGMCRNKKIPLSVIAEFTINLKQDYPLIVQALAAYHPSVATFMDSLFHLDGHYTLREMLTALAIGLKKAGTQVTGEELARPGAGRAIAQFKEHLKLLSESYKEKILSLSETGLSVKSILKSLESPTQCVETAAHNLQKILKCPTHQKQLNGVLILQHTQALEEALKEQQKDLRLEREDTTQRLPSHSLKQFLHSVVLKENNYEEIAQFLSLFGTANAWEMCCNHPVIKESLCQPWRLARILIFLTPNQIESLFETLKNTLHNVINNAKDFSLLLKYLAPEQSAVVLDTFKEKLPALIHTVDEFESIVHECSPDQITAIIEAIKLKLPKLINCLDDFHHILRDRSPEQRTALIEAIKEKIPALINTNYDFASILLHLTSEKQTALIEVIKEKLPKLINHFHHFHHILCATCPEQRTALIEAMKKKLPALIHTVDEFERIFLECSPEQRTALIEAVKEKLPKLINRFHHFHHILCATCPEQRTALIEAMKKKLPALIHTVDEFERIVLECSPDQITAIIEAIKVKLPKLINSVDDFHHILRDRSPEQRTALIEAIKEKMPALINTNFDFESILCQLTPEKQTALIEVVKEKLPKLINSVNDFHHILFATCPEQRTALIEAIKEKLPELINTSYFFPDIIKLLTPEQIIALIEAMKKNYRS